MRLPFLMEPIERLRDVLTKGTLFVGDGDKIPASLAPGAEGTVLTRRAATATGLAWEAATAAPVAYFAVQPVVDPVAGGEHGYNFPNIAVPQGVWDVALSLQGYAIVPAATPEKFYLGIGLSSPAAPDDVVVKGIVATNELVDGNGIVSAVTMRVLVDASAHAGILVVQAIGANNKDGGYINFAGGIYLNVLGIKVGDAVA